MCAALQTRVLPTKACRGSRVSLPGQWCESHADSVQWHWEWSTVVCVTGPFSAAAPRGRGCLWVFQTSSLEPSQGFNWPE